MPGDEGEPGDVKSTSQSMACTDDEAGRRTALDEQSERYCQDALSERCRVDGINV
jgi:hypothetical protein